MEHLEGLLAGALVNDVECAVDNLLSDGLLAIEHHAVHELGDELIVVERIREDLRLGTSRRRGMSVSYFFGRLVPYFERP